MTISEKALEPRNAMKAVQGKWYWRMLLSSLVCLLPTLSLFASNNCDCDSTATWESAFEKANIVFLGTCVDASPNTIKGGLNVVFQVDSSWKRAIEPFATVHSNSENQCGYPFKPGNRYIVFANKRHQTIATSECEPNQDFEDNGPLTLRRLGPGFAVGRPGMAAGMNMLLIGLGIAGMLFLAFVVLRKKISGPKTV
jgi:hypothetical protein